MKEASFSIVIIVDVCNFVKKYVTANPCFYFEELREEQRANFSDLLNISDSSICRALRFDLGLTRKVLTKRASESIPRERQESVLRKYGWSSEISLHIFAETCRMPHSLQLHVKLALPLLKYRKIALRGVVGRR
ncbi:hypothetical protein F441_03299 [Phytophthora nicotianae CJ01A1]|uniref:Uncharacterized protein n=1 Tax=Phytophthora nicotianae CJ01A1 TaxID=1317063 RepID=W2XNS4_PHYNI|nr:hypothetical protein F441_03299 [Phytophthora nicotianae CJ01A1]